MSAGRRTIVAISLSPSNPDAVVVVEALQAIPPGQRSAAILAWAAGYLSGRAAETPTIADVFGLSEVELDAALDDF